MFGGKQGNDQALEALIAYLRYEKRWLYGRISAVAALDEIMRTTGKGTPNGMYAVPKVFRETLLRPSTQMSLAGKILLKVLTSTLTERQMHEDRGGGLRRTQRRRR
eukprot:TRINITY_DN37523_c0_g1_i1.p1 TRINITY_DN37523_c0_g1~~TRINITY_DN37523_c0_g1_i1.p1  ORF type:complete len:106 (-),score=5.54 TRINITY_DN37523_c0_g1_i1:113-430(-)